MNNKNYYWIFFILILIILVVALVFRFVFLDLRVLHHDEGVNYFFVNNMLEGNGFGYNPFNYHGPFYFYAIFISFVLFGVNEFGLRLPAVIFGILLVLLPLLFKKRKEYSLIVVMIFLAISPSLVYYSRYSIHEMSFVYFSLLGMWSFIRILESKNLNYMLFLSISLSFLFVIKETVIIFLIVLFVLSLLYWKRIVRIQYHKYSEIIFASILIFLLIYVAFFTSFWSNANGLTDSFRGYLPWIDRGLNEVGHDKPFFYYGLILFKYELVILFFALVGLIHVCFKKQKNILEICFGVWFLIYFFIYSLTPYKTPWLIINFVVPMCFLAGIGLKSWKWKWKYLILVLGLFYLIHINFYVNFVEPWDDEKNNFAYVHTFPFILEMSSKVNEIYSEDKIIYYFGENSYWPLPFYLHKKNQGYYLGNEFRGLEEYEDVIFIFGEGVFKNIKMIEGFTYESYEIKPEVKLFLVWKN